jgi:hypothetical protein
MRRIYIILTALLVIPVVILVTYSGLKSDDVFSENLVNSLSEKFERELAGILQPVKEEILWIMHTYLTAPAFGLDEDTLATVFIPIVSRVPAIGSIMLYSDEGRSFTVYREKNTFVTGLQDRMDDSTGLVWHRRLRDGSITSSWSEMISGQAERRKALLGLLDRIARDDQEIWWPGLYRSNLLKEPVITAAVDGYTTADSAVFICSVEMPLQVIIRDLKAFSKYRERILFIATGADQLIEIPASLPDTLQSLAEKYLTSPVSSPQDSILRIYLDNWYQQGGRRNMTYHHRLPDGDWWLSIRPFGSFERIDALGLAVSEASMKLGLLARNYQVIIVLVLALASVLMYITAERRRKRKGRKDTTGTEKKSWPEQISVGENQHTEFKSALRWDQHLQQVNPKLEDVVVKSIAAFSNGRGGTLLIGVRDDGEIAGLVGDFNSLKKQDSDYFEIHLRNLLKQHFGIPFITHQIEVEFPVISGKEICAIRVSAGTEPVYITTTDKHGNKTERFYVRSGNSSQEIQSLKEITAYISRRFNI